MNISDAAREAAVLYLNPGLNLGETIQHGIDTATAALTLDLETVTRERDEARQQWAEDFETRTHLLAERDAAISERDLFEKKLDDCLEGMRPMAVVKLEAERDQLRQQLAEAREDTKRLDWLEKHPGSVMFVGIKFGWMVWGGRTSVFQTLREAIDTINPPTEPL